MEEDIKPSSSSSLLSQTRHYLSLDFNCENTAPSHTNRCLGLFRMIDQQSIMQTLLVKGWSKKEPEMDKKKKSLNISKVTNSNSLHACNTQQEIIKRCNIFCITKGLDSCFTGNHSCVSVKESPRTLYAELDDFDSNIKPSEYIPQLIDINNTIEIGKTSSFP
ncbi:uncharacterized protein LOC128986544 isoform X2 [Macrosteles quadrilineatus]|uniref:uncharacterized protein LOC128986544 isoform X2 n=1 Tax=Macrosteles quadrilineatus TaxID=74068 RepID=UPI0023E213FF|nr:uncharacterized protein LOC128986544 isoform X2 [Macrosteles quadrilineatus]